MLSASLNKTFLSLSVTAREPLFPADRQSEASHHVHGGGRTLGPRRRVPNCPASIHRRGRRLVDTNFRDRIGKRGAVGVVMTFCDHSQTRTMVGRYSFQGQNWKEGGRGCCHDIL